MPDSSIDAIPTPYGDGNEDDGGNNHGDDDAIPTPYGDGNALEMITTGQ